MGLVMDVLKGFWPSEANALLYQQVRRDFLASIEAKKQRSAANRKAYRDMQRRREVV